MRNKKRCLEFGYKKHMFGLALLNLSFNFLSEPFIEAIPPQVHILLVLLMLNSEIISGRNLLLFLLTFISSIFTATLGIAKFLKIGPCRLLPDQGPCGGHATPGFFLLMLNISTTIVSKGFILPITCLLLVDNRAIGTWIAICYLPQFAYVCMISKNVHTVLPR